MKLYHGTSDIFKTNVLLPPTKTKKIREDFRRKYRDKVFGTPSLCSAIKYAKKSVKKFGGRPIVYEICLINKSQINNTEFVGDKAYVKQIIRV